MKMQRPLIVMALESEGQGLAERLGLEVIYCGVGKVNAAYHLTRRLAAGGAPFEYVLNLGSAGSHTFARGQLVEASSFVQRDMDATGLGFALGQTPFDDTPATLVAAPRFVHLPQGVCASGDSFLQGQSPIEADIIDMEAYALAKVCHLAGVPFAV
jgi:adenosylhomocysteine nucleosidase